MPESALINAPAPVTPGKPEVLSPAGDRDCLRAAIENGADAVYFGLQDHNARARATNFEIDELPGVMQLLHRRGVRGYVALNTLVFHSELDAIEPLLHRISEAGSDAIIVQDLGLARLARACCPDLPIHASTQMTLTSAESIRLVEEIGCERVILARELSLDEIRKIRRQTRMPLEVFVHGALCVAYSGQCLTSEALGGRSANRGQCAQACRLPYEIVCDGASRDLDRVQYLLSPQDLAAYAVIPDLVALGMAGLKIEGRLKTPEYVANITRHYRMAVDGAASGQPVAFSRRDVEEMELSFSRGFCTGWLHGNNHKVLVQGRNPRKHGLFVGEVRGVRRGRVLVQLAGPLKRGDGIVFDRGLPEQNEQGGRVYEIFRKGQSITDSVSTGLVELAFGRGAVDHALVHAGDQVWKTDDPELTRRLRRTFTGPDAIRRIPIDLTVFAHAGQPLRVEACSDAGTAAAAHSSDALQHAVKHPADVILFREQLGRLGATTYQLRNLEADIAGAPMVPLSVLGAVRRDLIARLDAAAPSGRTPIEPRDSALRSLRAAIDPAHASPGAIRQDPQLIVLCRTLDQLRSAIRQNAATVYVDFQDIRQYDEAVPLARSSGTTVYLATPRIQKPAEGPMFKYLLRHKPDGILVRNLGGLLYYTERNISVVADFSLNAANELTVQLLKERGAQRVTASYDLNADQLRELAASVPAGWLEVVVHQHMPMFHMEHCVFCAFLSPGTDRTNCGRPCDHHDVRLRDRVGMEHPLKADVGCRNTLFNAVPQSAAEIVPDLLRRGVRGFRIELLNESASELSSTISLYRGLLAGEVTARDVWSRLKARNHVGVTRGPLEL